MRSVKISRLLGWRGGALVVLVLAKEKTTARQQNVFRFFGPRCLCQNFVTVGGVLVLVLAKEKTTARQQNSFRSPMPQVKILLSLLCAISSVPTASKLFTFFLRANNTQILAKSKKRSTCKIVNFLCASNTLNFAKSEKRINFQNQ